VQGFIRRISWREIKLSAQDHRRKPGRPGTIRDCMVGSPTVGNHPTDRGESRRLGLLFPGTHGINAGFTKTLKAVHRRFWPTADNCEEE